MDQNSLIGATHHTTPRTHSLGISTTFDICKLLINSKLTVRQYNVLFTSCYYCQNLTGVLTQTVI